MKNIRGTFGRQPTTEDGRLVSGNNIHWDLCGNLTCTAYLFVAQTVRSSLYANNESNDRRRILIFGQLYPAAETEFPLEIE